MKIGTKSILFGTHKFLIHPLFFAYAWWKRRMKFFKKEIIGATEQNGPFMIRYNILRTKYYTVRLHIFQRSDNSRCLHDHPWNFISFILCGGYYEQTEKGVFWINPLSIIYRKS